MRVHTGDAEIAVLQFAASLMGASVSLQITRALALSFSDDDEDGSELLQRVLSESVAFLTPSTAPAEEHTSAPVRPVGSNGSDRG
ncbi:hypothetical protein ACWFRT_10270 [Streptomyces anulatus]|uniref:hypothetical protein n=1 Tax=Streptomyces anulatus TaxID=1892 RepID=UPI00362ADC09